MKCDELQQVEYPIEWGLYYDKSDVDVAIAELKAELSDARDDARSSRNLINDKNEEIKELEDKIQQKDFFWDGCGFSKMGFKNTIDVANYVDSLKAENERLNRELEHVKNGDCINTCDVVEKHVKEEIKAKRALWLARANDASSFAGLFSTLSYIEDDETRTYWIFGNKRKIVIDGLKCNRMETAYKWFCIWDDVANKCLKKAEEYK